MSSEAFEASDVNGALAAMHGIDPKDETKGVLAKDSQGRR